jgi:hypothetical protein
MLNIKPNGLTKNAITLTIMSTIAPNQARNRAMPIYNLLITVEREF